MIPPPGWVAPFGFPGHSDLLSALTGGSQGAPGSQGGPASSGTAPSGLAPGEISGITGYSPALVGLGLSSLGAVPGSPFSLASKGFSLANSAGLTGTQNLTDQFGVPTNYVGPHSLTGLIGSLFGWGQPPGFFQSSPFGDVQGIPTDRSGETGAMGLGAQAAWDAVAAGKSPFTDGPQTGPRGINEDQGTGLNGPPGGGGGGGEGNQSHLCTLLYDQGAMDRETWVANGRFRASMGAQERRGYDRWAQPLARWLRGHQGAYRTLHGLLGWAPRAYMAEIRQPGSSRLGAMVLAVGLRGCRWLG